MTKHSIESYGHLWTFVDIYKNDDILEEHLLLLDKKKHNELWGYKRRRRWVGLLCFQNATLLICGFIIIFRGFHPIQYNVSIEKGNSLFNPYFIREEGMLGFAPAWIQLQEFFNSKIDLFCNILCPVRVQVTLLPFLFINKSN